MSENKSIETKRMYAQLPEELKTRFPEELKREIEENPTMFTMLKMVQWLSGVVEEAPSEEVFQNAEEVVDKIISLIEDRIPRMSLVFNLKKEHRTRVMITKLYSSCQRFCVAYNEEAEK